MKAKLYLVMVILGLVALVMGACASESTPPSEPNSTGDLVVNNAGEARDAALAYLREHYAQNAPSAGITWQEEDVTPKDKDGHPVPGAVHIEFTSDEWTVKVTYAVLPPENTVYEVSVSSIKLGWHWAGTVESDGTVTEIKPVIPEPDLAVVTDAVDARDTALAYIWEYHAQNAPNEDIVWQEENVTPPDWVGAVFIEFTSDEWTIKVVCPVMPPEMRVYQITLSSIKLGWHWKGSVKADGSLTEASPFRQMTEEESWKIAEEFLKNSPTFVFDGIEETFRLTDTLRPRCPYCWVFIFEFDSRHPGYGDRIGKIVAEVITHHRAVIAVEQLEITSAVMDDKWDMLRREWVGVEETLTVAELLENPVYDTLVKIHGEVSLFGELFCPCFELTSGGQRVQVWYDLMVENDGTERPPANMHEFNNGDKVIVIGDITYLFLAPPPEAQSAPTTTTVKPLYVSDYCTIDVDYPSEREGNLPIPEGFVTVRKGGAVTLPVTIKSLVDKPIKIRLTLGGVYAPEFVEYEYPKGYMTLNPGETIDTQIIVKALENAQAGDYTSMEESIYVTGYLQEPELGKMFSVFYLSIVD